MSTGPVIGRRHFLSAVGALSLNALPGRSGQPDFTLHIGSVDVEVARKRIIRSTGYNGSVPGPVLRMPEGKPVTVDVFNDTSIPELVHWHGLFIPPEVDGSAEEGTPFVPAHGHSRYEFVPRPSGTRWYHSHIRAGRDLNRATYTAQFGFLQVLPKVDPGHYDQEVLLALHDWSPFLTAKGNGGEGSLEVGYDAFTINQHALGTGEPIRVKEGQRVLFRILNASATLAHRLALAGHRFMVLALDGNPVPSPHPAGILELAPAERVDVLVEMSQPGCWILGETDEQMQKRGLGVVVEYAGRTGSPQWIAPRSEPWDYTRFGRQGATPALEAPDEEIRLVFKQKWAGNRWIDHWTINGKEYPKTDPIRVRTDGHYRLIFDNQSDDMHPVHLHRHSFELVKVAGKPTGGVRKDVVNVAARTQVEVRLVADNPGPSLFHCHMQLHMDFGFMTLMQYVDHPIGGRFKPQSN